MSKVEYYQKVQVISMSFGIWTVDQDGKREYPLHDPDFYNLIQAAHTNGIVLIAALGNNKREIWDWSDEDTPLRHTAYPEKEYDFPASYPEVIGVSATAIETSKGKPGDRVTTDVPASFTNFGAAIDLAAPGVSIESTSLDDGYGTGRGTSYASPHVSGVAALVLDQLGYSSPLPDVPREVRDILTSTAKPIGDLLYFGYGLVDAKAAVVAAGGDVSSPQGAPARRLVSPTGKLTVTWGKMKMK